MTAPRVAERMEQAIRTYIQACNAADARAIAACFAPDATHYFTGIPKWSGAAAIGEGFAGWVARSGLWWTVDQILTDDQRCSAVMEWTLLNPSARRIVRGVDWIVFDKATLGIAEIRSYLAARSDPGVERQEMQGFDYAARGYPTTLPDA